MRIHFLSEGAAGLAEQENDFAPIADQFAMQVRFFAPARKTRVLIMVSRLGHALVDPLYRVRIGSIPLEVPLIVSNALV